VVTAILPNGKPLNRSTAGLSGAQADIPADLCWNG
jgi:hypothetical protein